MASCRCGYIAPRKCSNRIFDALQAYGIAGPGLSEFVNLYHPDVCIHCAGRAAVGLSVTDPEADYQAGPALVFWLLDHLRQSAPQCRFVLLSSAAVYGNPIELPICEYHAPTPLSPYGYHKWQAELLCQEFSQVYGLKTASVRIFSAYGPGLRRQVIWDICQKAITKPALHLQGTGLESRDFIHALDIARALEVVVSTAPMKGEVYNLGSGQEIRIIDLAQMTLNALGLNKTILFDGRVPPGIPLNWRADITRLGQIGFQPHIDFEHGLKVFADWCSAELKQI